MAPRTLSASAKKQRTQLAAPLLAAAELVRREYAVSFTRNNTPTADLTVGIPNGGDQFCVHVKGLSSKNPWLIEPKQLRKNLFYILVLVAKDRKDDRFFVLTQSEMNKLLDKRRRWREANRPTDQSEGFPFDYARAYEERWGSLPSQEPKVANAETRAAMRESRAVIKKHSARFSNAIS